MIKLDRYMGNDIMVNPEHIIYYTPNFDTSEQRTKILLISGPIFVNQTFDEVTSILGEERKHAIRKRV